MKNKDYQYITEARYNQIIDNKEPVTAVRISFYKKLQQEDFDGIVYVEIEAGRTLDEVKAILATVRNNSYPNSLSFKEDISFANEGEEKQGYRIDD